MVKLETEYLKAIGEVSIAWSALEFRVDKCIWCLLGAELRGGLCVTANITSMPVRLRILGSLVDECGNHAEELNKTAITIIKRIEGLGRRRNNIIHGSHIAPILPSPNVKRLTIRATKKLVFESEQMSAKKINKLIEDIYNIESRLGEFLMTPEFWTRQAN